MVDHRGLLGHTVAKFLISVDRARAYARCMPLSWLIASRRVEVPSLVVLYWLVEDKVGSISKSLEWKGTNVVLDHLVNCLEGATGYQYWET